MNTRSLKVKYTILFRSVTSTVYEVSVLLETLATSAKSILVKFSFIVYIIRIIHR
jgi:hypothetical protein